MKGECHPSGCRRWWVATRSFTARCPEGMAGDPVTVTRQCRSYKSQADAERRALAAAKAEAEAQLRCVWRSTQCAITECSVPVATVSGNDGDIVGVDWLTDPPPTVPVPQQALIAGEGEFEIVEVGAHAIRVNPAPEGEITEGAEVLARVKLCKTAESEVSQAFADTAASNQVNELAVQACYYGLLPPEDYPPIGVSQLLTTDQGFTVVGDDGNPIQINP